MSHFKTARGIPLPSKQSSHAAQTPERLDSWKEIASYLNRGARTVQRWEREAGLPIHRLQHEKLGSVYAYRRELDAWWKSRGAQLESEAPSEAAGTRSIAVLPFADLSQEKDQQYFCEGLAEEIITRLAKMKALRVASRTSSFQLKTADMDAPEIGRRLHVGSILEGSVRKSADRLRIAVQLTDSETGFQIWSESYDRRISDIFAVQDELAHAVAAALEVTLSPREHDALAAPPTRDFTAYDYYLRGRKYYYQYGPVDMDHAVQLFMAAIEADPDFAQAYAGLADCWSYIYVYSDRSDLVREQANWASQKAMEMAPNSAEAQASRGLSLSVAGKDNEAEEAFESAIRLDPDLFEARYFYARHCFSRGQADRAIELYEAARQVRPDDFQVPLLSAQLYEGQGRVDEARSIQRRGVELAEQHLKLNPDDTRAMYMAAAGLAALGDHERSRELVERALVIRPTDAMLLYHAGCVFSILHMADRAIECLERAVEHGLTQQGWYEHDTNHLEFVRSDPRFQTLLDRL
jgi:TolB-like protein/Tfp pilus assembly protein PilF